MQRERAWWAVIIALMVMIGVSAFFGGTYYNSLKTSKREFANFELQLGILQDESSFLLERDLQLIDELDDLRNAIYDLEIWINAALEEGLIEAEEFTLEELKLSKDNLNSRISSLWSRIYDLEEDIRFLQIGSHNCTVSCEFCDWGYYCPRCGSYVGP